MFLAIKQKCVLYFYIFKLTVFWLPYLFTLVLTQCAQNMTSLPQTLLLCENQVTLKANIASCNLFVILMYLTTSVNKFKQER